MPHRIRLRPAIIAGLVAALLLALAVSARPSAADPQLDSEEQAFVTLINNYRAVNGLGPLSIDWEMQSSADWMSADMGQKAYFSHTDSLGRDPWTRMCYFGYCYNTWKGENIAAGYVTGATVFQGWHDSPGHNANMLGSHYTVMGLSRVLVQGSPFGWYWTNDFGGYTAADASPPPGPTNTPIHTPTATPTPTVTLEPTAAPTLTPTPTPTESPTHHPTHTPTPTPTPTPAPTPDPQYADVDCDSHLTGIDSVLILEFVAGVDSTPVQGCPHVGESGVQAAGSSGGARYHGDLDCNGVVDARDALVVLRAIAGDDTTPCS
jgi:uncharacterized protein YkwD